nr:glycosyltransferase family 2 protein [Hyphomonas sp. Mor2]
MPSQTPETERILAIIPTFNEEDHIEACIRSLLGEGGLNCAMVVCDGLSTDRTREIVMGLQDTYPQLHFLDNEKRLQSAAINHAVATLGTDQTRYVVRCDAHSIYPDNFIARVVESLEATGAASVVTVMDSVGETCFEKANAWVVDTPLGSGGSAHRGGSRSGYVDHGHHAGFDIDWFRRIGGYDEAFTHNEDAEYDHRLGLAGGKVYLDADIRIEYTPRGSLSALARQYYNYGKGRARTTLKHAMRPKIRQMIPVLAFLGTIFGIALLPVTPWLALLPLSYFTLLLCVSVAFAIARKSLCGLWTGPALAAMHMPWGFGFIVGLAKFGTGRARRDVVKATNAEE